MDFSALQTRTGSLFLLGISLKFNIQNSKNSLASCNLAIKNRNLPSPKSMSIDKHDHFRKKIYLFEVEYSFVLEKVLTPISFIDNESPNTHLIHLIDLA